TKLPGEPVSKIDITNVTRISHMGVKWVKSQWPGLPCHGPNRSDGIEKNQKFPKRTIFNKGLWTIS
ncbi:MAG: hypothetical protein RLO05_04600, partial [Rhodospirillales bacterium]